MSHENDSFIDEVSEELRRDRLFGLFRRYGWIGILAILLIVGGAGWREYSRAQATAKAQAFGDAVIAAEGAGDAVAALDAVDTTGSAGRAAVTGLLAAGAQGGADQAEAAARLKALSEGLGADQPVLRDLARLKQVLAEGDAMNVAQRDAALADLARPGAPFELLALEQQAVALIGAGRGEDAVTLIRQIQQKDGLSEGLRLRLSEMMIALGADAGGDSAAVAE